MDLISIIVPVYNVERYLDMCITSILNQTYRNLDIVLIDDGSTDASSSICDSYAQKDGRISVVHQVNAGLSEARNEGIKKAKGNYIIFIDSDDYIESNIVELLYQQIIIDDSDMAICDFFYINDEERAMTQTRCKNAIEKQVFTPKEALEFYTKQDKLCFVTAWSKIYRKELFDTVKFPTGKINEDEFVMLPLFIKCKKITFLDNKLYYYVQRDGSIMNNDFSKKRLDVLAAFYQRIDYALENEMKEFAISSLDKAREVLLSGYIYLKEADDKKILKQKKKEFNRIYRKTVKLSNMRNIGWKRFVKLCVFFSSGELAKIVCCKRTKHE